MARIETLFLRYRKRGDVRALGRVFDRTADETLRVAMYFARDPALAEEWLQQTYLTVIERAESWDASRPLLPWLLGILRNIVRRAHAERKHARLATVPPAPAARDIVEDFEWTAAVAEAAEGLADPYRVVILLRLLHGLAPAEIARLQRVPVATVRSQIHRGLMQLRASLSCDHRPRHLAALSVPMGLAAVRTKVLTAASVAPSVAVATAQVAGILTIGGLAVQKIAWAAVILAVLTVGVLDPLGLWDAGPDPSGSRAADAPSGLAREPRQARGAGGGPVLDTIASPTGPNASKKGARYVVAGRVSLGWKSPAPGRAVKAAGYAGYEAEGVPVVEADLVSDAEGRFSWTLPPPTRPMRILFTVPGTRARDEALALPDAPPPDGIQLYIRSRDAHVVGRVSDLEGRPIDGAEVIYGYRELPIACAEDGTFEVAVSSAGEDVSLRARAPGHAEKRAVARLAGPGSEARIDFGLPKEFLVTGTIRDADGRPLEGAIITSFMTSFTNKATSDARGRYELHHLDPGRPRHSVFARHASHVEARADVKTRGDSVTIDFQLKRGARVVGRVTDLDGKPLEGTSLYIGFSRSAYNRLDALAKDGGRYVFPVVEPGAQTLVASRPGYAPVRRVIHVPSDESAEHKVDIALPQGRSVRGRVVLPDGTPVAGAHVSWKHQRDYIDRRLITADDGTFVGHHLPTTVLTAEVYGTTFQRLTQAVPDGLQALEGLTLTVKPSAKIAGRVVDAHTGEPLASFVVRFVRADPKPGDAWVGGYSATWGREGHRFHDTDGYWDSSGQQLTAGGVTGLEISAPGYATTRHGRVFAKVDPSRDELLTRMEREARLTGTVVDGTDLRPIRGAVVKLYDEKHPLHSDGDDVHGRKIARTDAKGRFRLGDLGSGEVYLDIEHPDHAPRQFGPIVVEASGETAAGDLALGVGGSVAGKAADDRGQPLAGVRVEVHVLGMGRAPWRRSWGAETDADGRFRFDRLPPGPVTVWRFRPRKPGEGLFGGAAAYTTRVEVKAGAVATASLAPSGSATLHGKVLYDGDVPDGMEVRVSSTDPKAMHSRSARVVNGAFVFRRLEPGTYSVTCHHFSGPVGGPKTSWIGAARTEISADEVREIELPIAAK